MKKVFPDTLEPSQQADAFVRLGKKLWSLDKIDDAENCFRKALAIEPGNLQAIRRLVSLLEKTNCVNAAGEMVSKGLDCDPSDPELNYLAARLERRDHRVEAAIRRLTPFIDQPLSPRLKKNIHFELGHLYDGLEDAENAFFHFTQGNLHAETLARENNFRKETAFTEIQEMNSLLEFSQKNQNINTLPTQGGDNASQDPVFLVGFPRSGTTLLDLALDCHKDLQLLPEKPALQSMRVALESLTGDYFRHPVALSPDVIQQCRDAYFQAVDRDLDRCPGSILIDKLPLNIVKIPLIMNVFPCARFILAIRHPYDVCLSCFMQNFKLNNQMANFFSLNDSACYYEKVMTLWQSCVRVFKLQFHMVKMEELVQDFPTQMRRLLNFLGVGWDEAVMDYSRKAMERKRIHTPSYHQVVEPMNSRGVRRANRYANYLKPVLGILEPFASSFYYPMELSSKGDE